MVAPAALASRPCWPETSEAEPHMPQDFYQLGVQTALEKVALWPFEKEKKFPWWIPAAAGAAGLGAYGLARFPMLANAKKFPILRRIQEQLGGDVKFMAEGPKPKSWLKQKMYELVHGPSVWKSDAKALKGKRPNIWGGYEDPVSTVIPGARDPGWGMLEGEKLRELVRKSHQLENKLHESRVLGKRLSPSTVSIKDFMAKHNLQLRPDHLEEDLKAFQVAAKKEHGRGGYILKPEAERIGGDPNIASGGRLPTDKTDLFRAYEEFNKYSPKYYKDLATARARGKSINDVIYQYAPNPGHEGRLVDEMLNNNIILQKKLSLKQLSPRVSRGFEKENIPTGRESRVHIIGDKAVPLLATARNAGGWGALGEKFHSILAARWAQKNVVPKLRRTHPGLAFGLDVGHTAKGGFKVIETNPSGASGLLGTHPLDNQILYRTLTGRFTRPMSAALGLGAAGATAGTGALIHANQD